MIDDIRRRLRPTSESSWDVDQEFQPETDVISERVDTALVLKRLQTTTGYSFRDTTMKEHYANLVQSAINAGGRHGDVQISIPWLRMTLAGLESRRFDPEMMWEGAEEDAAPQPYIPGVISYEKLFHPEKPILRGI